MVELTKTKEKKRNENKRKLNKQKNSAETNVKKTQKSREKIKQIISFLTLSIKFVK